MTEPTSLVTAVDPAANPAASAPAGATPPAASAGGNPAASGGAAEGTPADKPKDGEADKGKLVGAPEKYDFKLPEGVEADTETLGKFEGIARELNMNQEQAQALVDLYAAKAAAAAEQNQKAWTDLRTEWVTKAKADKEFGGQNFDANIGVAKTALKTFGTPELNDALAMSGIGDHPEMVRLLVRVGKAIGEDKLKFGNAGNGAPKDAASIIYPNHA